MEKNPLRVVAVSYTNTIPFIYGLQSYPGIKDSIELQLMPPAACAEMYRDIQTDIALVPLGAMAEEDLNSLCCQWCLGAEGPVESVLLLANTPVDQIRQIFLDTESRTSVLLVQILAKYLWNISPEFIPMNPLERYPLKSGQGIVLIGDKTFGIQQHYTYVTDLAAAWQQMTGLPAVFACWLTKPGVTSAQKMQFNEALSWGVAHIDEAIRALGNNALTFEKTKYYLTQNISYRLDDLKMKAIKRFFEYRKAI